MTLAGIVCAICRYGTDLFVRRDLVEQVRQDGRITYIASRDLDGPNLQRFLVDTDVYLVSGAALWAPVLAGVPLAHAFGLDAFISISRFKGPALPR